MTASGKVRPERVFHFGGLREGAYLYLAFVYSFQRNHLIST